MNIEVPAIFQLRIEVQALANGLRRGTSDRLKLLRLTQTALATAERSGVGDGTLRARLRAVRDTLEGDLPLDRAEAAAAFQRFSGALRQPAAMR